MRRDRAALVLALHYARHNSAPWRGASYTHTLDRAAMRAFRAAVRVLANHVGDAFDDLWDAAQSADDVGTPRRLLRARLALYLRAVLRADAGDLGPLRSVRLRECAAHEADRKAGNNIGCYLYNHACGCHSCYSRRVTALWLLAPTTGLGVRPVGLRSRGGA